MEACNPATCHGASWQIAQRRVARAGVPRSLAGNEIGLGILERQNNLSNLQARPCTTVPKLSMFKVQKSIGNRLMIDQLIISFSSFAKLCLSTSVDRGCRLLGIEG